MAQLPLDTLIQVLRDRDIPYDRAALEASYNDGETGPVMQDWIREYLTPETLLTKDEAAYFSSLSRTGEIQRLSEEDHSTVRTLNEQELRSAIEELNRSTAQIEKQAETLRLQQNALDTLIKTERKAKEVRAQAEQVQKIKWDSERDQVNKLIEDTSQNLAYQSVELQQHMNDHEDKVKGNVEAILDGDDKLLLSLQKLASDLEPPNPKNDSIIEHVRELCARLIKHTVEGVRTKLDRIYLEALGSASSNASSGNEQDVTDLRDELESLYAEILPVAQMSAEQQFLQPALGIVARIEGRSQERAFRAFEYINDCLKFLCDRNDILLLRAEERQAHNAALKLALENVKHILSKPLVSGSNSNQSPNQTTSNTPRRRKSSVDHSPSKIRPLRRRSSSSGEGLEPEHQLARNLGITLPDDTETDVTRIEALQQFQVDRSAKLALHYDNLQSSLESGISSHLNNAHMTLQVLQDTLLSQTPYGKVKHINAELVKSVDTFQEDVEYVQSSMEEINIQVLQEKNAKRDQMIERWLR